MPLYATGTSGHRSRNVIPPQGFRLYNVLGGPENSPAPECGTKSSLPNTSTARSSRKSPSLSFFARTSAYKLHHTEQFPCLGSMSTACWISPSVHLHSTRGEYVPVSERGKMLVSRQHRLAVPSPPTLADSPLPLRRISTAYTELKCRSQASAPRSCPPPQSSVRARCHPALWISSGGLPLCRAFVGHDGERTDTSHVPRLEVRLVMSSPRDVPLPPPACRGPDPRATARCLHVLARRGRCCCTAV